MFLVPAHAAHHDDQQHRTVDKQAQHILRDGDVQRTHLLAGRIAFHDFAVVGTALGHVQPLIRTFLQPGRREHMPARTAFHDYRQRNAYLRIAKLRNVPLVGIANVSEHQFVHVDVPLSGLCLRQRSRNRHQQ